MAQRGFAHAVQRYTKLVFGGIVAIMAISLVFWGASGPAGGSESGRIVARFFGGQGRVTEREWDEARAKSLPYLRWKMLDDAMATEPFMAQFLLRGGLTRRSFSEEDIARAQREILVLLFHARTLNIRVSEEEVTDEIEHLFELSRIGRRDLEGQQEFTRRNFGCDPPLFKAMMQDALTIRKALGVETAGAHVPLVKVYDTLRGNSVQARVVVIGIDPEKLPGEPPPVTDAQIATVFENWREQFKTPEKV